MAKLTVRGEAILIANKVLDFTENALTFYVPGDPDCNACILARHFNRALEQIEDLEDAVRDLGDVMSEDD